MQTTITARHCEIDEALRERATEILARLATLAPRPLDAVLVFDVDGDNHKAELRVNLPQGQVVIAEGAGSDHRSALDFAEQRARGQLRRAAERPRRERKPTPDKV